MTATLEIDQLRKEAKGRLHKTPQQLLSFLDDIKSSYADSLTANEQVINMLSCIAVSLYGMNKNEIYTALLNVRNALMAEVDKGQSALAKNDLYESVFREDDV